MAETKKTTKNEDIQILKFESSRLEMFVLGKTPFICNAMSAKAKHDLLLPRGRLSEVERQTHLKHDPLQEYRESPYKYRDDGHETRIYFPVGGFKKAIMTTALEMPGASKASIARLVWIDDLNVDLYGVPQMLMSVVRSADIKKTPDIRTRAILPEWAAHLWLNFVGTKLTATHLTNLFYSAGLIVGVGDYRQEKGAGSYGQFTIIGPENAEWADWERIVTSGQRQAQDAALEAPDYYDIETEELYLWYQQEVISRRQRGRAEVISGGKRKVKEVA